MHREIELYNKVPLNVSEAAYDLGVYLMNGGFGKVCFLKLCCFIESFNKIAFLNDYVFDKR